MEADIKKVKDAFKKHFKRDISDQEAEAFYNKSYSNSKLVLSKIPGYSEDKFRMGRNQGGVYFSPATIIKELYKSTLSVPNFEKETIYIELMSAVNFCIATLQIYNTEWSINLGNDPPDIRLVATNLIHWNKKLLTAILFEVVELPDLIQPASDVTNGMLLAEHIKIHKIDKYGPKNDDDTWLLVNVRTHNFREEDYKETSEILKTYANNPFSTIFATNEPKPDSNMILARLLPTFRIDEIILS